MQRHACHRIAALAGHCRGTHVCEYILSQGKSDMAWQCTGSAHLDAPVQVAQLANVGVGELPWVRVLWGLEQPCSVELLLELLHGSRVLRQEIPAVQTQQSEQHSLMM